MEENAIEAQAEKAVKTPEIAGTEVQEKDGPARGEPESSTLPTTGQEETPKETAVAAEKVPDPATEAPAPVQAPASISGPPEVSPVPATEEAQLRPPETVDPALAAPQAIEQPATPSAPVEPPEAETQPPIPAVAADAAPAETALKPDLVEEPKTEDPPKEDVKTLEPASALPESKVEVEKPEGTAAASSIDPKKEEEPTGQPATSQPAASTAQIAALEKSVNETQAVAEDASQRAQIAVAQATALAQASGMPYNPPMQIPAHMVPPTQAPPVDAMKLDAQAAVVNADIQRRREALVQQQVKEQQQQRLAPPSSYDDEDPSSPTERAMPPRRAASAKAAQMFRRDADDYLSESPMESPPDSPRQQQKKPAQPKPKPPAQPPAAAKPTQSKDSGADAWEEPPQKQLVLKLTDITKALQKKWLQLYWPDDGKWWPCQVVFVDPRKKTANVLYETGEEEADLELAEMVQKGEVAWLNASDAKPEVTQPRRGYARQDDYDEPSTSRGRGRKQYDDDDDDEDDDEEGWAPGRKRRAAVKGKAKYEESEPESSESESLPPSDQSSDWHSSEDEDKPKRRPKKKKRPTKPAPRIPQSSHHHHHHHTSQTRDRQGMGGHGSQMGGNMIGRGGIFEDTPGFGGSFGGGGSMQRMQQQGRGPEMNRDQMQAWGNMGGGNKNTSQYPGSWNRQSQGLDHIMQQNRQQMNNGNMGQLHIPQVSMQGGQMLDLTRYQQAQAAQAAAQRGGQQMGWRPQPGASDMMRSGEWAQQMQNNPLFRLQQMGQHGGQMGHQQGAGNMNHLPQLMQQQMLQQQHMQQRLAQQQGQQTGQATDSASGQRPMLGSSTKNMEGIVAQGLNVAGKHVEVQQANGQWTKGTIMAVMGRGPQGGSALIHFDNGEQKQLSVNEEGRSYNIKLA